MEEPPRRDQRDLVAVQDRLPVAGRAWVTEGQASDIAHARAALEAGAVPTPRGPARTRPGILSGDKACSSRAFRNYLRRRKIAT